MKRIGSGIHTRSDSLQLLILVIPAFIYVVLFQYVPMWGAQIAFRNFSPGRGILQSPWVGLRHFKQFFSSYYFGVTLKNTLLISGYQLLAGFPLPVILAIMLHYVARSGLKRTLQTLFYAPNFISVTVVASMIFIMLSPSSGVINFLIRRVGGEAVFFMASPEWFYHIFVASTIWQYTGVGAIIYLGVLTSVDPALHESAMIDGAGKVRRIVSIDLPALIPTMTVLLILNFGRIMFIGFDRAFLLQTPLNLSAAEVIPTYIYKAGVLGTGSLPRYSFATAIGLFQSAINLVMIVTMNAVMRRYTESSLY
jgi:putative aldouronate transport system permease protein